MTKKGPDGLAFLRDRDAFVRRFVLAEVLAAPRGRLLGVQRGGAGQGTGPVVPASAPSLPAAPAASALVVPPAGKLGD